MTEPMMTQSLDAPKKNPLLLIVGLLVMVGIAVFVFSQKTNQNASMTTDETEEMEMDMGEMDMMDGQQVPSQDASEDGVMMEASAGALAIEVEGGSYYYDPNIIRAKVGDIITVTLKSADMMHDFVIDELGVESAVVPAGKSTTVTFTVAEAGEYEFYCSVSNHRAMGMVGTLIVEE